ncbi:hypothetical protein JMUB6875_62290 [Nocardia sp. JMUB6875]
MRAYRLPTTANSGKLLAVAELLPHWQRGLVHVQLLQTRKLREGETRLGWLGGQEAKSLPGYLSQRQWKSVVNQVNMALTSWQGLAVSGVRDLIGELDVADEVRTDLYRVNARKAWWADEVIIDGRAVSPEVMARSKELIRQWLWRNPFPNLAGVRTMLMDGPIAGVSAAAGPHADFWVRVSTLTAGKPVSIPLHGYPYFDDAAGEVRNFTQVHVSDEGTVSFSLVKKSLPANLRECGDALGIDWGLANIFTTSDGQILGQAMFEWLRERDTELTTLTASLQRQGIKLRDSQRFRALNQRVRAYVRNEINRLFNRLAARDIRQLVVEKLDFRFGGLSRRLNRILSRAGRTAVTEKLASLTESHGIAVVEVNPAHTSRQCSGCGYTDKRNRTSQKRFHCRFCGNRLLADINAARNILRRSQNQGGWLSLGTDRVLAQLDQDFTAAWRYDPTRLRERPTPRGRSTAPPSTTESINTMDQIPRI